MLKEWSDSLSNGLETLRSELAGTTMDLDTHIRTVGTANRMLAAISTINNTIREEERIWKIFEEYYWDGLSRREQKMVSQAFLSSTEELMEAKRLSSERFLRTSGLHIDVRLPDRPVPSGRRIDLETRLWTDGAELEIDRLCLQTGTTRWKFSEAGDPVLLKPGSSPLIWRRAMGVPPGTDAGLLPVPLSSWRA